MKEETIINGVRMIKDGNVTHFITVDTEMGKKAQEDENTGFFRRLWNWLRGKDVDIYVKMRDIADPFRDRDDCDVGCDGKECIEAGIKITF